MISFLGHIKTNKEDLPVTLSSLQFSNIVKKVRVSKLKTTIVQSASLSIKTLQYKLDRLQEQMYLNSMLQNNDLSFNLTQNRVEQVQHAISEFMEDKAKEINVLNVTDAMIAMNIFRDICTKLEEEKQEALEKLQVLSSMPKVNTVPRISVNKMTEPRLVWHINIDRERPNYFKFVFFFYLAELEIK